MAEIDAVELKRFGNLTAKAEETTSTTTETAAETKTSAEESIHTATATTVSSPIDNIHSEKATVNDTNDNPMAEVASGNETGDTATFSSSKSDMAIEMKVDRVLSAVIDGDYSAIKKDDPYASKKMFMAETMKGTVAYGVSREKLRELTIKYAKDLKKAQTPEEKRQLGIQYKRDTRMKINEKLIEERLREARDNGTLTPEEFECALSDFEKFESKIISIRLGLAETKQEEEWALEDDAEDQNEVAKSLATMTKKYMPQDINEETANKYFDILQKYPQMHMSRISEIIASGNFSEKFIDKITNKYKSVLKKVAEYTQKFITEFWQTEKGKAIRAYTKQHIAEIKEAKKEYIKSQETAQKAKEEAEIAKAESEKAIAKAKEEEKKANSIAESLGYKDLEFEDLYKVVKHESPRQATELEYAQVNKKKAYWAEYDANVAKQHASFLEDLARKNLEFARIRMWAAMQAIQAFFG